MYGDVEDGDVSGGHGYIRICTLNQHNGLKPLISLNNSDNIEMNEDLKNGDVIPRIGLINSHTLSQFNKSSYFNDMD